MKIIVDLDNPVDVAQALQVMTLGDAGAPAATPPAPTPAPAPAATTPPAPAPAPALAPAPAPAPAPAAGAAIDDATFAGAVQAYAGAHGPKATKAKFAEYGYTKVSDVPADQRAGMMTVFAV